MKKIKKKGVKKIYPLTDRQIEVLTLICKEVPTIEMAKRLKISKKAVEQHRDNIKIKTNSRTVIGIYRYALQHGLVKLNKR